MKHIAKIQSEFLKISAIPQDTLVKAWWHRLSRDEQIDYLRKHPKSKLKVRAVDIPIGAVQHTSGQTRLLTHDKGWLYFSDDEKDDLQEEKNRVNSFLESQRYSRNEYKSGY